MNFFSTRSLDTPAALKAFFSIVSDGAEQQAYVSARVINEEKRDHYQSAASLTSKGRHLEIININGVINGKGNSDCLRQLWSCDCDFNEGFVTFLLDLDVISQAAFCVADITWALWH